MEVVSAEMFGGAGGSECCRPVEVAAPLIRFLCEAKFVNVFPPQF